MAVQYRGSPALTNMKTDRAHYVDPTWWMLLLILLCALILGLWGEKLPTNSQSDVNASRQTATVNLGPSAAELIPIFSGNPGSSTSLGGNVSLGGGSH